MFHTVERWLAEIKTSPLSVITFNDWLQEHGDTSLAGLGQIAFSARYIFIFHMKQWGTYHIVFIDDVNIANFMVFQDKFSCFISQSIEDRAVLAKRYSVPNYLTK